MFIEIYYIYRDLLVVQRGPKTKIPEKTIKLSSTDRIPLIFVFDHPTKDKHVYFIT